MTRNHPVPQQIYRHFKGSLYQILSLAEHTETGEQLVIYQAMYGDFKVYARPLSMFMEKVDSVKYPQASQEYRFELVTPAAKQEASSAAAPAETVPAARSAESAQSNLQGAQPVEASPAATPDTPEELNIDPLVLKFLEAGTYEERLDILSSLHPRITDDMINTMAMAIDVEVAEGELEERYGQLRKCLLLYDKFECTRLR